MTTLILLLLFGLPLGFLIESLTPNARLRSHLVYSLGGWLFAFGAATSLLSTDPGHAFPFTAPSIRALVWAVVALWVAYFWVIAIRAAQRACSRSGFTLWVILLLAGHALVVWGRIACLPIVVFAVVMFVKLRPVAAPAVNHPGMPSDSPTGRNDSSGERA